MEIKDTNNSGLLNLLQANRTNAGGNVMGMSGFGDLLAGLEDSRNASAEKASEFVARKDVASADFSKPVVKEKQPLADKRNEAKAEKTQREPAEKKKNMSGQVEDKSQSKENVPSKKVPQRDASEGAVKAEAPEKAANVESGENVSASVLGESSDIANGYEVSLDALALMGVVTVVNPVSGEMVQMTGEELAAQLSEMGIDSVMVIPSSEGVQVFPVSDAPAEVNAFQEILQEMQPVEMADAVEIEGMELAAPAVKTSKTTETAEVVSAEENPELEAQAAQIGEAVGKEHKVKVEVNVKAEKIADLVDQDLVSARPMLRETTMQAGNVENANPLVDGESALAQVVDSQNASQVKNMNPVSGAVNGAAVVSAPASVENVSAAVSSENTSVSLASAGAAGNEMLANARSAAANDSSASFRDVYKGMGKEVVEQIKVNITKSAVKGVDTIEIQLKPEDLGKIEVKMQIGKDGKLQAHIVSSRPETAELLQKEMANLQKAFDDAGFQTDENSLNFSFRDEGQTGREQERNELRSFIGNALEQEAAMDAAGNDLFSVLSWDGNGGLNIRV
mgnify:CR=1 FL=1